MPEYPAVQSSEAVLTRIVQQVVQLDLPHLEQLSVHLGDLIEQLKPVALPDTAPPEIVQSAVSKGAPLCGSRGSGYIEWKWIRQGNKVYGPYPYWRFVRNGKRCSIYLKELAQELRQSASNLNQTEATD